MNKLLFLIMLRNGRSPLMGFQICKNLSSATRTNAPAGFRTLAHNRFSDPASSPTSVRMPRERRRHLIDATSLSLIPSRGYAASDPREHYDALGLTPKATNDQVKSAYFKLSKIYHPDVCRDPAGAEKFVKISKAYKVLGTEDKRRDYDRGVSGPHKDPVYAASATRAAEINYEDLRRYQEASHNEGIKSRRSTFVKKGTVKGLYDFDAYYREHYADALNTRDVVNREKASHQMQNMGTRADRIRRNEPASTAQTISIGVASFAIAVAFIVALRIRFF